LLLAGGAAAFSGPETQFLFTKWVQQHSKKYEATEFFHRYQVFKANLEMINSHNSQGRSWDMEMNSFGDLTTEEFKEMMGYNHIQRPHATKMNAADLSGVQPEADFDWRSRGAVTGVKDQAQCGSCWAFSTTGSIEGAWFLSKANLLSLSEQELVDCAGSYGNLGCNGGLMDYAFEYAMKSGLAAEDDYKYTARDGSCRASSTARTLPAGGLSSYKDISANSEADLIAAINIGPVSVAIEADQSGFQFYKSGVFDGVCGTNLDHGVLAVGYGTDSGKDYWTVKNSWGVGWGDQGYIRLVRGKEKQGGQCGILMASSYPVVA